MRIDPTGRPARLSGRRIERTGQGSGPSFAAQLDAAMESSPVVPNAAVETVSNVLALQEVGHAVARARRRGEDMLDRLDEIRHGLLLGSIPRHALERLDRAVRTQIATTGDPRLTEILQEIELRARVELAKIEKKP